MSAPTREEQLYFRQIEETFIRLRGTPFLLSPSDWRLAQGWYTEQIPVEVVCRALEELFARRADRGAAGKVQSLRYCAAAVESAWRERRELGGAHVAAESYEVDVESRLAKLVGALPPDLPEHQVWTARILAANAEPAAAEGRLAALDRELIEAAVRELTAAERRRLEEEVEASLGELRGRMTPEALAADRLRLLHERARQLAGLPLLSLFSPDALSP
jgi:hypothetical protein